MDHHTFRILPLPKVWPIWPLRTPLSGSASGLLNQVYSSPQYDSQDFRYWNKTNFRLSSSRTYLPPHTYLHLNPPGSSSALLALLSSASSAQIAGSLMTIIWNDWDSYALVSLSIVLYFLPNLTELERYLRCQNHRVSTLFLIFNIVRMDQVYNSLETISIGELKYIRGSDCLWNMKSCKWPCRETGISMVSGSGWLGCAKLDVSRMLSMSVCSVKATTMVQNSRCVQIPVSLLKYFIKLKDLFFLSFNIQKVIMPLQLTPLVYRISRSDLCVYWKKAQVIYASLPMVDIALWDYGYHSWITSFLAYIFVMY